MLFSWEMTKPSTQQDHWYNPSCALAACIPLTDVGTMAKMNINAVGNYRPFTL